MQIEIRNCKMNHIWENVLFESALILFELNLKISPP